MNAKFELVATWDQRRTIGSRRARWCLRALSRETTVVGEYLFGGEKAIDTLAGRPAIEDGLATGGLWIPDYWRSLRRLKLAQIQVCRNGL